MSGMKCTRIPYASRADANRAAKRSPGFRVYQCHRCGQWHTTAQSRREIKARAHLRKLVSEAADGD